MSATASPTSSAGSRSSFRGGALLTGVAMGGCVVLSMLWLQERRQVAAVEERLAVLKAETTRYRDGLLEEVARNKMLTEELKNAKDKSFSQR